jgi:hypothetical protein
LNKIEIIEVSLSISDVSSSFSELFVDALLHVEPTHVIGPNTFLNELTEHSAAPAIITSGT